MKNLLLIPIFLITNAILAQQRIGLDINSHLINLNTTVHYQQVLKGPLIFSTGIYGGSFGEGENTNSRQLALSGLDLGIAYPNMTESYTDNSGTYKIVSTYTRGLGFGAQLGLGCFVEFKNFHGIRANVNSRIGWMKSDVRGSYAFTGTDTLYRHYRQIFWHPIGSITAELYHTMRLDGRWTFYWGFKMPYSFSLDKGRFNPKKDSELFYKLQLDLSLGFTRAIGKCE